MSSVQNPAWLVDIYKSGYWLVVSFFLPQKLGEITVSNLTMSIFLNGLVQPAPNDVQSFRSFLAALFQTAIRMFGATGCHLHLKEKSSWNNNTNNKASQLGQHVNL